MGNSQSSGSAISGAVSAAQLDSFRVMAEYAAAAYCNTKPNTKLVCGSSACPTVQSHNTQLIASLPSSAYSDGGYIGVDHTAQFVIVAFRGSEDPEDFNTNINFIMDPMDLCNGCKVHEGFLRGWQSSAATVLGTVHDLHAAHPSYRVLTAGYSVGATQATLAAAYLRKTQGLTVDAYTYGSPRIGNEAFARFVSDQKPSNNYRVTHTRDPVPRLPGSGLGFRHTDVEYWLSTGGSNTVNYAPQDVKVCRGTYNDQCNSGTNIFALDLEAHKYYFRRVSACS